MMTRLGQFVARRSGTVALTWGAACALLFAVAPDWSAIVQNDEFAFLRDDVPSRRAEAVFRAAFPSAASGGSERTAPSRTRPTEKPVGARLQDPLRSNLVIVVRRKDLRDGLQPADFEFVEKRLRPRLEQIEATTGRDSDTFDQVLPVEQRIIRDLWTPANPYVGPLLESESNESILVVLELGSELIDSDNDRVITRIKDLLNEPALRQEKPAGLDLVLSGSAVVGRDVLAAESFTARRMEWWTLALLVVVFTWLHRAPLLAFASVGAAALAVHAAIDLAGLLSVVGGLRTSTLLVIYLKGVGYAVAAHGAVLMLAAYRQALRESEGTTQAVAAAVARSGPVLAWSAGAAIAGLAVLTAADFGKLRQAGIALPLTAAIAVLSAMTLLPALVSLLGRWAYWPDLRRERISTSSGWMPTMHLSPLTWEAQWQQQLSSRYRAVLQSRTALLLLLAFVLLLPLAIGGALQQNDLSYGMLAGLPPEDPGAVGARAVQEDFPDGIAGATTLLIQNPALDLNGDRLRGRQISQEIAAHLWADAERLKLADVRCEAHPWGMSERATQIPSALIGGSVVGFRSILPAQGGIIHSRIINKRAHEAYTSIAGDLSGQVLRMDLVFARDPFTARTIEHLTAVEQAVRDHLPEFLREGTILHALGPTASLRDLKETADADRRLLIPLAAVVLFLWLSLLSRRPVLCGAVVLALGLVGLASLSLTRAAFAWPHFNNPTGLDWRVPVLALMLVLALGSSLCVPLLAELRRVPRGESRDGGPAPWQRPGLSVAAGIVTAIAWGPLLVSPLNGLAELGMSLAWGFVLSTATVQLLLVPAWRVLMERPLESHPPGRAPAPAIARSEPPVTVGE